MRSRISIFLLGLAMIATMCFTGCSLGGDDNDDNVIDPGGSTTISGSISTSTGGSSLRAQAAPTSATIGFYYLNDAGEEVAIRTGIPVTFTGTSANYSFGVSIPTVALQKRNFLIIAITNTNETIEGVIPFDPNTETNISAPPIDPDDAGPVAFVRICANPTYKIPNVDIGNVLSIYTPADIKAMLNPDGTPKTDLTNLIVQVREREQAMVQLKEEFTEYAAKIQQLMDYSLQLARNPEYMGFDHREDFEEAMKAKAIELGLPVDAMSAIDAMEGAFIGSGIPVPPSEPGLNFDNFKEATEQKRELEMLGNALTYFAGLLNKNELNEIKTSFMTAADLFFSQVMAGGAPEEGAALHPFFILDQAREIIFTALGEVVKSSILLTQQDIQNLGPLGTPDQPPTPEQIIEHKKALFELVINKINANYASLTGAPTDATEKAKFIQALATLASIPMIPQVR